VTYSFNSLVIITGNLASKSSEMPCKSYDYISIVVAGKDMGNGFIGVINSVSTPYYLFK
jgi:hypothetical protein